MFFAVCNTIFAMIVTETRAMYLSAWCAIVLLVLAGISWYAVESEAGKLAKRKTGAEFAWTARKESHRRTASITESRADATHRHMADLILNTSRDYEKIMPASAPR